MIAPSVSVVEAARDRLDSGPYQGRHLGELIAQAQEVRAACPNRTDDFYAGYALGVEAARVLLETLPAAILAKVSI